MSTVRYSEFGVERYNYEKQEWEPIASAYEWVNKRTRPAKPNNKTMKYKVTTEILEAFDFGDTLTETDNDGWFYNKDGSEGLKREVIERNPDWFEPVDQVQEGQYYKNFSGSVFRIQKVHGRDATVRFIQTGNERVVDASNISDNGEKLSTHEIEQALVKEAKRRGFKDGQQVKRDWVGVSEESTIKGDVASGGYFPMDDSFLMSEFGMIYKEGEFAEIVDQTPTIEINGNKVEFNDHPKVGCTTIKKKVFIEQAKTIARHGVRIHRKGEDITDQILAIASHYGYAPKDKGIEYLELEDGEGNVMVRFGTGTISYDN